MLSFKHSIYLCQKLFYNLTILPLCFYNVGTDPTHLVAHKKRELLKNCDPSTIFGCTKLLRRIVENLRDIISS